MRAVAVPDAVTVTTSGYDVPPTTTVCPALTRDAAAPIEQNGCVADPLPVFEHDGFMLSTYNDGGGIALAPGKNASG